MDVGRERDGYRRWDGGLKAEKGQEEEEEGGSLDKRALGGGPSRCSKKDTIFHAKLGVEVRVTYPKCCMKSQRLQTHLVLIGPREGSPIITAI